MINFYGLLHHFVVIFKKFIQICGRLFNDKLKNKATSFLHLYFGFRLLLTFDMN